MPATNKKISELAASGALTGAELVPVVQGGATDRTTTQAVANLAPAETTTTIGALINGATAKTTPVDADQLGLMDSAAANILKKLSWANLKATLKTYTDTLYALVGAVGSTGITMSTARLLGRTTASTGAIEEITVGSGLTLSGGSLTATGSGGTVTATAGSLTSNAVVLGAGTTDTKVVAGVTTDGTSKLNLGVAGSSVGAVVLANATSGTITVQPPTGALGTVTLTAPATTGTIALTSQITGTNSGTNTGDQTITLTGDVTGSGTGSFAATIANSAVTNAKSANMANSTIKGRTTAGTGAPEDMTAAQTAAILQGDGTTTAGLCGFREIPQNSKSAAYTTVAADSGKHLLHPSGDANARTFTIDSNANVPYPVGTAITFVNETSQVLSIAITSDTLTLANSTSSGTRSLAQNGVATALKVTSTKWIISGTGLT
jgi:hypothetical protein